MQRVVIIMCIILAAGLSGCSDSSQKPESAQTSQNAVAQPTAVQTGSFRSVSPQEAQQLINTRKDMILLDCRTPEELRNGSIEGFKLISFWAIMQNKIDLPKDKPILLVCAVGGRSYAAGRVLSSHGYKEVYNLNGGIAAWKNAGLPLKYQQ